MFGIIGKVYAANCEKSGTAGLDIGDCLQLSTGVPVSEVYDSPAFLVNLLVRNIFVIAGVIIFLLIFYAGFKFIQDDTKGKEEAKKIATAALVGAITMFSAYWIVQILAYVTGTDLGL